MSLNVQFINDQWLEGQGAVFQSINPANGEVIWQGAGAIAEQVNQAIIAARAAFYQWSDKSVEERIVVLQKFAELLKTNTEALATVIAKETGKPIWETRTEVGAMIGKIAISIKANQERTGTVENPMPGAKAFIRHKPHGVVAVFGPYNFPGHLPNGHIVPALLAGNTVVFKPSEQTAKTAIFYISQVLKSPKRYWC